MRPPAVEQTDLSEVKVYEHLDVQSVIETQVEKISQLQNDVGSFLVYDVGSIIDQYSSWMSLLPNVLPSYVVGCNDDPVMLKTLARLGARFCCSNKREIEGVLATGVEPARVTFFNPVKPVSNIKYCAKIGLSLLAFDNEMELRKIKAQHPKAELVLQVAVGLESGGNDMEWMKGCPIKSVASLLRAATSMGLTVSGISAELGRPNEMLTGSVLEMTVKILREVYDIASAQDVKLKFIDLGNITWNWSAENPNFTETGSHIATLLATEFPACLGVELRAQVSNLVVSRAVTLVTSVIAKRRVSPAFYMEDDDNGSVETKAVPMFCYYLNDGAYGTFSRLLADNMISFSPSVLKADDYIDAPLHTSTLMGPTCDDLDCIVSSCHLPQLCVGDWLVFNNIGGACAVPSTQSTVSHYVIDKLRWSRLCNRPTTGLDLCLCMGSAPPSVCYTVCPVHFTIISSNACDTNNNTSCSDDDSSCHSKDSSCCNDSSCESSCYGKEDVWIDM